VGSVSKQAKSEYALKFQDPRWQKKRLEILKRDEWACKLCGDRGATLHVHHRYYLEWGTDPWKYPDEALVTLCETCHDGETMYVAIAKERLHKELFSRLFGPEVSLLAACLGLAFEESAKDGRDAGLMADAIKWICANKWAREDAIQRYMAWKASTDEDQP
jgi:hypothetical protein